MAVVQMVPARWPAPLPRRYHGDGEAVGWAAHEGVHPGDYMLWHTRQEERWGISS